MKKTLTLLAVTIGFVVASAAPAFAHATLDSTNPAPGARVATSPPNVTLYFSEPVTFEPDALRVYDSKGNAVKTGKTKHAGKSSAVSVSLPKLSDGVYALTWRVI